MGACWFTGGRNCADTYTPGWRGDVVIYDPARQIMGRRADLNHPRFYNSTMLLPCGGILTFGSDDHPADTIWGCSRPGRRWVDLPDAQYFPGYGRESLGFGLDGTLVLVSEPLFSDTSPATPYRMLAWR